MLGGVFYGDGTDDVGGRKQPLFVITTILGISAIFKSYPSIGDTALYLSLLSLYRHIFPRMLPSSPPSWWCSADPPPSDALHLLCHVHAPLCNPTGTRILLPVDLCRIGQRKLLLRHHAGMVSCRHRHRSRRTICSSPRRMGNGAARDAGEGYCTDIKWGKERGQQSSPEGMDVEGVGAGRSGVCYNRQEPRESDEDGGYESGIDTHTSQTKNDSPRILSARVGNEN